MSYVFFEWQDFEEHVKTKHNLQSPANSQFLSSTFELSKALGAEGVSIFVDSRVSNSDLDALKNGGCKALYLRCAGFNMLDVNYAKSIGLAVFRVASYSPESIAEYAIALMLNLGRKMNVQRRDHVQKNHQRTMDSLGFLLKGKTLGLHGYGKIARSLADIARNGFGMKVQFVDPFAPADAPDQRLQTLEELYSTSDVISIHTPLLPETRGSVNYSLLSLAKPNLMLINTARGPIVNSEDLVRAMNEGKVQFAGVDVWNENDHFDDNLLKDNCFQSYHVAFFTEEAVASILRQTFDSQAGNPEVPNVL